MFRAVKVGKYSTVKLPDTFEPAVMETNGSSKDINENELRAVDVHFGVNMDIAVCVAKGKKLTDNDKERIRLLVGAK
jgi:hypothetical protein